MSGERDSGYVSWSRPTSSDPVPPAPWWRRRPEWSFEAFLALLGLLVVDAVLFVLVTAAVVRTRLFRGVPCATYWHDLGGYARVGVVFVVALVVVSVGLAVWRRWHPLLVVVTQVLVAALLLPSMVHTWSVADDVSSGRIPPSQARLDAGGCDAST